MKKLFILFLVIGATFSCTDHFEELNEDKKNPTVAPGEPLFTNATRDLVDFMQSINVNNNVFRLYAQYWAQTTYPDESQYNMVGRENPDAWWTQLYRDVLNDYKRSKELITEIAVIATEEPIKTNKLEIISIMEIYTYTILVDMFGDVPYTDALNPEQILPKYDDAQTIYNDLFVKLDDAIGKLDDSYGSFSTTEDLVYGGDVAKWKKFANSLKLRMALRIADADNTKASTAAQAAVTAGVFTSNADNFSMTYFTAPPNTNPIWVDLVQSGRSDFVAANTLVDQMNAWNDPRRAVYFTQHEGGYAGGTYGDANSYNSYSHIGPYFENPSLSGTIMSYAEVCFLLAEAVERGYTVTGTAEEYYNNAITASMNEFGVASADITTYLAQTEIAYTTATGDWKEKIGRQKWISMFNQGFDGWTAWRQFDFSGFNPPPGMTASDIPTRFIYPIEESTLNPTNSKAAGAKYGNDSPTAKIFWDVN